MRCEDSHRDATVGCSLFIDTLHPGVTEYHSQLLVCYAYVCTYLRMCVQMYLLAWLFGCICVSDCVRVCICEFVIMSFLPLLRDFIPSSLQLYPSCLYSVSNVVQLLCSNLNRHAKVGAVRATPRRDKDNPSLCANSVANMNLILLQLTRAH